MLSGEAILVAVGAMLTVASSLVARGQAKSRARRAALAEYSASRFQDRHLILRSAVSTRRFALGTVRVGGTLVYAETYGTNKEYLDMVIALASNECDLVSVYVDEHERAVSDVSEGIETSYLEQVEDHHYEDSPVATFTLSTTPVDINGDGWDINDISAVLRRWDGSRPLTISSVNPTTRQVTISDLPPQDWGPGGLPFNQVQIRWYTSTIVTPTPAPETNSAIVIEFRPGTSSQAPVPNDPLLGFGDLWTEDHRLLGIAYIRAALRWNQSLVAMGAPTFGAIVRGKGCDFHRIYDPRIGATVDFSDNPALLAGWYMTLSASEGGMGIPSDWIDWDSVGAAANICDELITVRTLDGEGYEQIKRYQCDTVIDTEDTPAQNIEIICSAMAETRPVFTGGKYRVFAGAFRPATITIRDSDVQLKKKTKSGGEQSLPITYSSTSGEAAPPNVVKAIFADRTKNWNDTSAEPVRNETYIALDGRENPIEITLPATTDPRRANYLMGVRLEQLRPRFTVSLTVGGIGEDIALKDSIQFELSGRSFLSGRTFEVVQYVDHLDGTFFIVAQEIKPQMWALDPDTYTPSNPEPLPDQSYLWNVPRLQNFRATVLADPQTLPDGTAITNIELSWDAVTAEYIRNIGHIEIRYLDDQGRWAGVPSVPADSTSTVVSGPFADQRTYTFEVRAVNGIGIAGPWAVAQVFIDGTELAVGVAGSGLFTWTNKVGVEAA